VQCHYKRCSPQAFLSLLQSFKKCVASPATPLIDHQLRRHCLSNVLRSPRVSKCAPPREALEQQVESTLLRSLLHYPDMSDDVDYFINAMSTKAAQAGKKRKLFTSDADQFPEVTKYRTVRQLSRYLSLSLSRSPSARSCRRLRASRRS
jgi:hypothetical protein